MAYRSDTLAGVCREFGNAYFIMASGGFRDMQLVERLQEASWARCDDIDADGILGQLWVGSHCRLRRCGNP